MEELYDPMTGQLKTNSAYLDQGYKFDPTTGRELSDGGLFSSMTNKDMVGAIGGIGQLGLGLFNFMENKKFNKARIGALGEQIASSKYARNTHKNFVSGTRSAFGAA